MMTDKLLSAGITPINGHLLGPLSSLRGVVRPKAGRYEYAIPDLASLHDVTKAQYILNDRVNFCIIKKNSFLNPHVVC